MIGLSKAERDILYDKVIYSLGGELLNIEIDNKTFDINLIMAIEEYSAFINNWIVEQQFPTLQGLEIDSADITYALTTKTLDFEQSFAASYSKQFGVGNTVSSKWELKKDYIVISANTQMYNIPAGREVNEVLWVTPPNIPTGGFSPASSGSWIPGAQGWFVGGYGMQAALPSFSLLLYGQDRQQKKKLLQSELTYRIVGGIDGTKNIFLYPIPGSGDEMTGQFGKHYDGSFVFYFYYETNSKGRKKCLEQNNDIIKTPNDIPLSTLTWNQLNDISKVRVRQLLVAKLKRFLAINRGKFSGEILGPNGKTLKLDYDFLESQAKNEEDKLYEGVKESLGVMSYDKMMEMRANISDNLARVMKNQAPKTQFFWK